MGRDLIHRMRGLFPAPGLGESAWEPAADVYQTPDGWLVKFDLAGVKPGDVKLSAEGRRLTVQGTRRDWCLDEGCCHYRLEITYSEFERSVVLPNSLDRATISAEHRDGMLLVRIQQEGEH